LPAFVVFGLLGLFFIGRQADLPFDVAAKCKWPKKTEARPQQILDINVPEVNEPNKSGV
jgi:hypothetical protein